MNGESQEEGKTGRVSWIKLKKINWGITWKKEEKIK